MVDFSIRQRLTKFDDHNLSVLNNILDSIQLQIRKNIVKDVTSTTNMDTDIAGNQKDLAFDSRDSTIYVCTVSGEAGSATWVALH